MSALRIDRVYGFEHGIPPALGAIVAGFGVLFLLLGWRMHRLSLAAFGLALGALLGQLAARWLQVDKLWGLMSGGLIFAVLSGPLYRAAVFLLAGLAVGVLAGEGFRLLVPGGFWFGFAPGFLVGGVLSLWLLRPLVILSTSLLGALALWWGGAVAIGAWVYRPSATFSARHPVATTVMVGGLFLVGSGLQFMLSPRSQVWDEDEEEEGE